jgi:hypothetical protein
VTGGPAYLSRFTFARSISCAARPSSTAFHDKKSELVSLIERRNGGHDELLSGTHDIDQRRPLVGQDLRQGRPQILRLLHTNPLDADGLCHGGEIGIGKVTATVRESPRLHLKLNKAERAIVQQDDFNRQILLQEGDELSHHHRATAVARK